jgi:hypothetical protein
LLIGGLGVGTWQHERASQNDCGKVVHGDSVDGPSVATWRGLLW